MVHIGPRPARWRAHRRRAGRNVRPLGWLLVDGGGTEGQDTTGAYARMGRLGLGFGRRGRRDAGRRLRRARRGRVLDGAGVGLEASTLVHGCVVGVRLADTSTVRAVDLRPRPGPGRRRPRRARRRPGRGRPGSGGTGQRSGCWPRSPRNCCPASARSTAWSRWTSSSTPAASPRSTRRNRRWWTGCSGGRGRSRRARPTRRGRVFARPG